MLAQLDALAETCPGYTLDALVPHLFGRGGFGPDRSDYYDPRNSLLNHVLERRVGIPITLSVARARGRPAGRRADGRGRDAGPLPAPRQGGPDRLHRPVPRRATPRRAAAARPCSTRSAGADSTWSEDYLDPVGNLSIVGRMLNNLRITYAAPPGPGRAALGDGAADRAAGALRRRPRGVRPGHGPAQLTPLARSRAGPTRPRPGARFRPPHPVSSLPG